MEKNKILRVFLLLIILLLIPIFSLWIYIAQPSFSSNKKSNIQVSEKALEQHVKMLSETFYPRGHAYTKNLDRTADYIKTLFSKTKGKVSVQEYNVGDAQYKNVICRFGSSDKDLIVVGAHYDGCFDTPGADDNASGVAGLLEIARLINNSKNLSQKNIELVAYSTEEPPHFGSKDMGSYIHAKSLADKNISIKGVLILEMIGYFTDTPNSQTYPSPILNFIYPSVGNFIVIVGKLQQREFTKKIKISMKGVTDLPTYSINAPSSIPGIDFSDHRNYWIYGYNAVMITDTSFFRNKNYHSANDTYDTLDYKKMAQVVISTYQAILEL